MKKYIILALGIFLMTPSMYSQTAVQKWTEDFDGNVTFNANPAGSWVLDSIYYAPNSPGINPRAYLGVIPRRAGNISILQTPSYDFRGKDFVLLRFYHICKVSPSDTVLIQYRLANRSIWDTIPNFCYEGKSLSYNSSGFSAKSYPEWQADDSTVFPAQSWWKEEVFDLSSEVKGERAEFRFVIKHGPVPGTQVSYGWLLDNIDIFTSTSEIKLPVVEFISSPTGNIYSSGPFTIQAKVKTTSNSPIRPPWLKYISLFNGVYTVDSVEMTQTSGDSLWSGNIPQLQAGTKVIYSIKGEDGLGHYTIKSADYLITIPQSVQTGNVIIGTGTTNANYYSPYSNYWDRGWSRSIYMDWEFNPQKRGGITISEIAYYADRIPNGASNVDSLTMYFKAVRDTVITISSYVDPIADEATLVWGQATSSVSSTGWINFTLNTPFYLPEGYHLMVYWNNKDGNRVGNNEVTWRYTTLSSNKTIYSYADNTTFPTTANITLSVNRPNARFQIEVENYDSNSVEIRSIDSPVFGQTTAGNSFPITVTFRNRGSAPLTTVNFGWSLNGVIQPAPPAWTGSILWDYETQHNVVNYTPRMEMYDTILVWVTMPNGHIDSVLKDDTLSIITFGCNAALSGTYTVGANGYFSSIAEVIDLLKLCTPVGNITLNMESGVYNESWDFTDIEKYLGQYTLTITSQAKNKDDVILRPPSGSTAGILLNNARNLQFEHITVNIEAEDSLVYGFFCGTTCENIVINNCAVLGDTTMTTSGYMLIGFQPATFSQNITIKNNYLRGSYYGIFTGGGSSSVFRNVNMIIDSNIITHQYNRAIHIQYTHLTSVAYNTVKSRTTHVATLWYGISVSYSNGNIIGNRVHQQSNNITSPYGIYLSYYNYYNKTTDMGTVFNNEVIVVASTGTYYGIYSNYANARIINNSVYVGGTSGATRGIYVASASVTMEIKNNNIVMGSSSAYPIYLASITYLSQWDINFNNYYAPTNIGYANGAKTTFTAWTPVVTSDVASVKIRPYYIDSTKSLELLDYTGLECPFIPPGFNYDINGDIRSVFTAMGCYNGLQAFNGDLMAYRIVNFNGIMGTQDTLKLERINTGSTTISSASFAWNFNGTSRQNVTWNRALLPGKMDTVTLGVVTYTQGANSVEVYLLNSNLGNSLVDLYPTNDTVRASIDACFPFNGQKTIGSGGDFETIEAFWERLAFCGVNGDVEAAYLPGVYTITNQNMGTYMPLMNNYKLTITSTTKDTADVTLRCTSGTAAFILNGIRNFVIDAVTIDVSSGVNYGIQFTGACTNVVISNCRILSNPTTVSSSYADIYKATGTGIVDSIFIINNTLDGGYYGLYFYGGTGVDNYGTNVFVDSNTFSNNYCYVTYFYYTDFKSVSYNKLLSRTSTTTTSNWYGLYFERCNVKVIGNIIRQRTNAIAYPMAMYFNYVNTNNTKDTGLIANNDAYISTAGITYVQNGTEIAASQVEYINNILYVYCRVASGSVGLRIVTNTTYYVHVRHNIFITTGFTSYPVSVSGAFPASNWVFDENLMYSPINVGTVNGAIKGSLDAWQLSVATDKNSVSFSPDFIDGDNYDYRMLDTVGMGVLPYYKVTDDITGAPRGTFTNMGPYHYTDMLDDVRPVEVLMQSSYTGGTSVPVTVTIKNSGRNTLTSAKIDWMVNGTSRAQYSWTGSLVNGAVSSPIVLGNETISGFFDLVVYTSLPNGLTDMRTTGDTITFSAISCDSALRGTYTVGSGGDINNFETAWSLIEYCGIKGNVTLSLFPGNYSFNKQIPKIAGSSRSARLTIASSTNNANDVIFNGSCVFDYAENITLKNITINNAAAAMPCIEFLGTCSDIEVNGCNIKASTTSTGTNSSAFYYLNTSASGKRLEDIRILNNNIDGGYANIYLYYPGYATANMSDVTIDNNIMTNAYCAGVYSYYYGYYRSISYNTIRTRAAATTQYGTYLYYYTTVDTMRNNKIRLYGTSTGYGIYANVYVNGTAYNAKGPVYMVNNEIIKTTNGTNYGIFSYYLRGDVFNNSIYLGGTGANYGLYFNLQMATYPLTVKNNLFITTTTNATNYPIYAGTLSYVTPALGATLDYNNYYSTGANIGYVTQAIPNITSLRGATQQDQNSISYKPTFKDINTSLELADTCRINCPIIAGVNEDIRGLERIGTTNMGAYGYAPYALDAKITTITTSHTQVGVKSMPSVVVNNLGRTTIASLQLGYSFNGIVSSVSRTVTLPFLGKTAIDLDSVVLVSGSNDLCVWVEDVNGQGVDLDQTNDSLCETVFACYSLFKNASFVVGPSGAADFPTITDAINEMFMCGVSGDVTLLLESGTHAENVILTPLSGKIPDGSILTITSLTGNAVDAIIRPSAGAGVTLSDNQNIIIKNITIDVSTSLHTTGILLNKTCSNIEIYGCTIKAYSSTSTTASTYRGISYTSTSGSADYLSNIRIIKNTITGGYYSISNSYATGASGDILKSSITIDSNTLSNAYNIGIALYNFGNYLSISYNNISYIGNTSPMYTGIETDRVNLPKIIGNKIRVIRDTTSTSNLYCYGITFNPYSNGYSTVPGLVANNEITLISSQGSATSTSVFVRGIYLNTNCLLNIYHNSFYLSSKNSICHAINKYASVVINIERNVFYLSSANPASYLLYATNLTFFRPANGTIDYNNYYNETGPHIAYVGGQISTLSALQTATQQDVNSQVKNLLFTDVYTNLRDTKDGLLSLLCPSFNEVTIDKDGEKRLLTTAIGAYTIIPNLLPSVSVAFENWEEEVIEHDSKSIDIRISNFGMTPVANAVIDWTIDGVLQTPYTFAPANPLTFLSDALIRLDNYEVSLPVTEVKAWIRTVNSSSANALLDTAVAVSKMIPLAEFIEPFIDDTVNRLTFNLYIRIRTATGAPATTPELKITTRTGGDIFYDSISLSYIGDEYWVANIPEQYYGSKVIYSLTVEDTLSNPNHFVLMDSTYIKYGNVGYTLTVGSGEALSQYSPVYYTGYGWSRQLYLSKEINPSNAPVVITKLAWEADNYTAIFSNQTCYIRLTDDTLYTSTAYIDPVTLGATQVWTGTFNMAPGWCEITFTTPFVLPPNKNIEVIWHNQSGTTYSALYWKHTVMAGYMSIYRGGTSWSTTTAGTLQYLRPNARFTIEYSVIPYQVYDLGLTAMIEPLYDPDALCTPDYTPVKIALTNMGAYEYNFALIPVTLNIEVTSPIQFSYDTIIRSGILTGGSTQIVEITSQLPIMAPGLYDFKTWLTNIIDNIKYDDTLLYTYTSGRMPLPIDERFNTDELPLAFKSKIEAGTNQWDVYQGKSPVDSTIVPAFGSGMLGFIGQRGSLTRLSTRQLDLYGTSNPKIDFWYFHDTIPSQDYTDVLVTLDGGATYTELLNLVTYNQVRGWRHYTVPLSDYMTESCVIIVFESMISSWEGAQYIDRIWISSEQDLALTNIIITPAIDVCSMDNKQLYVEIKPTTIQAIDFNHYPTSLEIEIPSQGQKYTIPLQGILEKDTAIFIANLDVTTGNYAIRAYLTEPIDNYSPNDTFVLPVSLNPDMSVQVKQVSGGSTNCLAGESPVWPEVIITNTGNMDLSNIGLILQIDTGSLNPESYVTIRETCTDTIPNGNNVTYTFKTSYSVPWHTTYYVGITAYLLCDSALVNGRDEIVECTDTKDLYVVSIDNPSEAKDTVGATVNVTATLRNHSDYEEFTEANITVLVTNSQGVQTAKFTESKTVGLLATVSHTFVASYTVSEDSVYYLIVFVDSYDNYPNNDTMTIRREAVKRTEEPEPPSVKGIDGAKGFTLGQNIPNPANSSTRIDYTIPEAREVVFNLHSISGQLLYSKTIEASSGKQSLELNTSSFAAGIYFYSIEYKGQRLVKRMMISGRVNE